VVRKKGRLRRRVARVIAALNPESV
jgi:hypothetical protein